MEFKVGEKYKLTYSGSASYPQYFVIVKRVSKITLCLQFFYPDWKPFYSNKNDTETHLIKNLLDTKQTTIERFSPLEELL